MFVPTAHVSACYFTCADRSLQNWFIARLFFFPAVTLRSPTSPADRKLEHVLVDRAQFRNVCMAMQNIDYICIYLT